MGNRFTAAVPHVLVDARPLNGARNGISRFVEQLMAAWPNSSNFQTTLISNRPIRSNAPIPTWVSCRHDNHPLSHLPGTLWMSLRVPALVRDLGATHFLGTQHVLPLWRTRELKQSVILHDLVFALFPETMARVNRHLSSYFAPRSIRRADHIFCVSKTTRSDLQRHFGAVVDLATVCYPGRTILLGDPSIPSTPPTAGDIALLVVGSMEPRKNIAPFLEAFLIAADRDHRLRLDLVSSDAWGHALGDVAWERIRQHPGIRIHQRITDQALNTLYNAATYLVFPSIYEGFGLPILEAVGHCAVIANDIPIFREIAGKIDGVKLVNLQTTPAEIAERLLALITESDYSVVANDHGLFSWQITANRIVDSMGLEPVQC